MDFTLQCFYLFLLSVYGPIHLFDLFLDPRIALFLVAEASAAPLFGIQFIDATLAVNNALVYSALLLNGSHKTRCEVIEFLVRNSNLLAQLLCFLSQSLKARSVDKQVE